MATGPDRPAGLSRDDGKRPSYYYYYYYYYYYNSCTTF